MEVIRAVLVPSEQHRFVATSDAAEHVPGECAGGFLLVLWRTGLPAREAFVTEVSLSAHLLFTPGDHKIAQWFSMPSQLEPHAFVGPEIDNNVTALMCLIRGRSDSPDLQRIISFTWTFSRSKRGSIWNGFPRNPTSPIPSVV